MICLFSTAISAPAPPKGGQRERGRSERFILVTFLRFHSKCVHLNLYRKLCLSTCPPCRIRWEIGQWLTRSCSTHARPACKETRRPRMKTKYRAKTQHDHLEHWQSRYMTHPDFAQESPSVPADLRGSRWGSPLCVGKIVCVCVCVCLQLQQSMHFVHLVQLQMGPGRGNDIGASPFRADLNKYSLQSYRAIWMSKTLSRKQDFSYFSLASAASALVVCNLRAGPRQSEDMSMPMPSAPSDDQNARNSRGHTGSQEQSTMYLGFQAEMVLDTCTLACLNYSCSITADYSQGHIWKDMKRRYYEKKKKFGFTSPAPHWIRAVKVILKKTAWKSVCWCLLLLLAFVDGVDATCHKGWIALLRMPPLPHIILPLDPILGN